LRETVKHVNAFFVCGDEQYRALRGLGVPGSKIFVANEYPGHDYSQIRARKIEGLDVEGKIVITFIGRFVKFKGIQYLLEAYSKLEKECPNCMLIVHGRGPRETELKAYAKTLGINDIVFLGPRWISIEEKKFLFEISSMIVVPSIIDESGIEGGPLIVLEALSAGTPVLGTKALVSSTKFIRDGVNGFVVPHSDPQALHRGMKELINWKSDSAVRERVIHEFKKVKGHEYQFEQIGKAILSCFDK
jgi:glycosyltransferase involved in cell wall biosynthesis